MPNGGYQQNTMNTNGWADHNLNEDNFSEPQGVSVKSFDAFRMAHVWHYVNRRR